MTEKILLDAGPSGRGWHRLELVLQCPQKYAWTYGATDGVNQATHSKFGAASGTALPLIKGSLFHIGLAHHYARIRETQNDRDPEAYYTDVEAVDLLAKKYADKGEFVALDLAAEIQNVLSAYKQKYAFESFKVLNVEEVFEGRIGQNVPMTGRYDMVVKESDGRVWIYDHKTSFKVDDDTILRYSMSGQFMAAQYIGRQHFGSLFGGVRLNMVGLTTPYKFVRRDLPPAPFALGSFVQTVEEAEERISRFRLLPPSHWPKVISETTCVTSYGKCQFFDKCRWGA